MAFVTQHKKLGCFFQLCFPIYWLSASRGEQIIDWTNPILADSTTYPTVDSLCLISCHLAYFEKHNLSPSDHFSAVILVGGFLHLDTINYMPELDHLLQDRTLANRCRDGCRSISCSAAGNSIPRNKRKGVVLIKSRASTSPHSPIVRHRDVENKNPRCCAM